MTYLPPRSESFSRVSHVPLWARYLLVGSVVSIGLVACSTNPDQPTDAGLPTGSDAGPTTGRAIGEACTTSAQCKSNTCSGGLCQEPGCVDLVKNGSETDVDCGGTCALKCAVSLGCAIGSDCTTGVCVQNRCAAASCSDRVRNGSETDVDCGGGCPSKCGHNNTCQAATDCFEGVCTMNKCKAATCTDKVKNGSEPDVDCGGACPTKCAASKSCINAADCIDGVCTMNRCVASTCADGLKNGDETDLDCGGSACQALNKTCGEGLSCLADADCARGACIAGKCRATSSGSIAAGSHHTCVVLDTGELKCWGRNNFGQLGLGDTVDRLSPSVVPLGAGRTARSVASGTGIGGGETDHTCAILDTGAVKCWGHNDFGQLGLGDTVDRHAPGAIEVPLGSGRTANALAMGFGHTCALLDTGAVKCWGRNGNDELGLGDRVDRTAPGGEVPLGAGRTAKVIAAGGRKTCALLDTGMVRCWGETFGGVPVEIDLSLGRTGTSIVLGAYDNCVMLDRGDVRCWQLSLIPLRDDVFFGVGRTAKAVWSGGYSACALLDTSGLKCWGQDYYGVLGSGGRGQFMEVDLGAGRTVRTMAVGDMHACAVLDTGTVKCWGRNSEGQLGLGDNLTRTAPTLEVPLGRPVR